VAPDLEGDRSRDDSGASSFDGFVSGPMGARFGPTVPSVIEKAWVTGQADALGSIVQVLDDRYFLLQESRAFLGRVSEGEVLRAFAVARAVSALEFAMRDEPLEVAFVLAYVGNLLGRPRRVFKASGGSPFSLPRSSFPLSLGSTDREPAP